MSKTVFGRKIDRPTVRLLELGSPNDKLHVSSLLISVSEVFIYVVFSVFGVSLLLRPLRLQTLRRETLDRRTFFGALMLLTRYRDSRMENLRCVSS